MDELIEQLTSKLGIDPAVARTATGKAMQALQSNLDNDQFAKIAAAVPGIQDIIRGASGAVGESSAEPAEGGGWLGQLAGVASKVLGKEVGGGLELGTSLTEAGIPSDKLAGFVTMIINFIRQRAGDEIIQQVLAKFPLLKAFLSQAG